MRLKLFVAIGQKLVKRLARLARTFESGLPLNVLVVLILHGAEVIGINLAKAGLWRIYLPFVALCRCDYI